MGCYVNPPSITKEEWLEKNGLLVGRMNQGQEDLVPTFSGFPSHHLPVILVDNAAFTAAGVAYCPQEYDSFLLPSYKDSRPKLIYSVEQDKLLEVSDLKDYLPN